MTRFRRASRKKRSSRIRRTNKRKTLTGGMEYDQYDKDNQKTEAQVRYEEQMEEGRMAMKRDLERLATGAKVIAGLICAGVIANALGVGGGNKKRKKKLRKKYLGGNPLDINNLLNGTIDDAINLINKNDTLNESQKQSLVTFFTNVKTAKIEKGEATSFTDE